MKPNPWTWHANIYKRSIIKAQNKWLLMDILSYSIWHPLSTAQSPASHICDSHFNVAQQCPSDNKTITCLMPFWWHWNISRCDIDDYHTDCCFVVYCDTKERKALKLKYVVSMQTARLLCSLHLEVNNTPSKIVFIYNHANRISRIYLPYPDSFMSTLLSRFQIPYTGVECRFTTKTWRPELPYPLLVFLPSIYNFFNVVK